MEFDVLVYTALRQDAVMVDRVLRSAGMNVRACASPAALDRELAKGLGVLLVVEEVLGEEASQVLSRHLHRQAAWSDLPILVMTSQGADSPAAQRAVERLGNVTLLERPVRTMTLTTAARSALRGRGRQYEARALGVRKDQFLAALAHELRNPLAPIRNASAVLQRLQGQPNVAKLANIVDRQVNHLTRLVDDLLDVARATSGKLELQLGTTKSRDVVTHALEIADAHVLEKSHRLVIEQPEGDVFLRADHVRLVQSVANLLVNAAKFTPPGGDIRLAVRVPGNHVEFIVTDSGCGLHKEDLQRIFEIFEQARVPGQHSGGLGLGLHLVKAFAELHGGEVFAQSEGPGRGSQFTLRLPVVVQVGAHPDTESSAGDGVAFQRVLVVDDNVDAAITLQSLLLMHGLEVHVLHDGAAAVEYAALRSPDVIVMDIGMPGMDGYEAARRIRANRAGPPPLLIALTGWGQYVDKRRATEAGFDCHFVKPLKLDQLFDCLRARRPVRDAASAGAADRTMLAPSHGEEHP